MVRSLPFRFFRFEDETVTQAGIIERITFAVDASPSVSCKSAGPEELEHAGEAGQRGYQAETLAHAGSA
jgi:hypothetical protein